MKESEIKCILGFFSGLYVQTKQVKNIQQLIIILLAHFTLRNNNTISFISNITD